MISILLIDDEKDWLLSFRRTLLQYEITTSENIHMAQTEAEALASLANTNVDLVFLDMALGESSGQDVLQKIKQLYPELMVIIMSGISDIHMALSCGKLGATDYMVKTAMVEELISNIRRITKIRLLEQENNALKNTLLAPQDNFPAFSEFITASASIYSIFSYLTAIAVSSYPILITGESGVGKGIIARAAGRLSRPDKPFVAVNVGGLDSQIFSDTLFGHKKGAYTSAESNRMGAVQQAGDGTLFLDEIGDLPNVSQLKLLYLAQDGEYQQLGSDQVHHSRARFIFATNKDLEEKCKAGEFRRDLYYRLKTHFIHIPPLRERPKDIPVLFRHFIALAASEFNKPIPTIQEDVIDLLCEYSFPGNIRQLRAICFDLMTQAQSRIKIWDVKKYLTTQPESTINATEAGIPKVNDVIDKLISEAMERTGNNQTKAAAMIGISQSTLSRRLRK